MEYDYLGNELNIFDKVAFIDTEGDDFETGSIIELNGDICLIVHLNTKFNKIYNSRLCNKVIKVNNG